MHPLDVEIRYDDISINFNYIMVVMYETLPDQCVQGNLVKMTLVKQFSHQTHQHQKTPELQHILMEDLIYEIKML